MKLIVGLGNPGPEYAETRHNAGWRVAARLAERAGVGRWREKFSAFCAETRVEEEKVVLMRPVTYMNRSGRSVRSALDFWKMEIENLLVIVDDMHLDLGRLRIRPDGSAGGHNGLASVAEAVGREDYPRLRLGIGPAPAPEEHVSFVLGPFRPEERGEADAMIERAADAAQCWIRDGLEEAMNRYNQGASAPGT